MQPLHPIYTRLHNISDLVRLLRPPALAAFWLHDAPSGPAGGVCAHL